MHILKYTKEALNNLNTIKKQGNIKKLKKIKAALDKIIENPRHPGFHTHKYQSVKTLNGDDVFQSYAENSTLGAYRIFWHWGPEKDEITIIAIIPHP